MNAPAPIYHLLPATAETWLHQQLENLPDYQAKPLPPETTQLPEATGLVIASAELLAQQANLLQGLIAQKCPVYLQISAAQELPASLKELNLAACFEDFETFPLLHNLQFAVRPPTANGWKRLDDGIYFRVKNRLEKVPFAETLWLQASDIYSVIRTEKARYLVSHKLKDLEAAYPIPFMRVHRSYMVNLSKIEAIEDNNLLIDEEYIPVGQTYKVVLMKRLWVM